MLFRSATTPRPVATAPRPVATAVRPTVPTTRPPATASIAPRPVAQPAETGTQASAGAVRGMIGSSMARQAATSTPQLSARAQALKAGGPQGGARARVLNQDLDLFDIIKGHLLDEGYADTEESALVIMANMSEEWRCEIIEALRDIWSKPGVAAQAQMRSPFANQPTKSLPNVSSPFAKPPSRTDSGKLTTYGAGGGAAAERGGKTRAQVIRQGAANLERKTPAKNQGPDFGR